MPAKPKPEASSKGHPKATAKRKTAAKPKAAAKAKGKTTGGAKAKSKAKPQSKAKSAPVAFVKREPGEKPDGYVFGRPTDYKPEYCQLVIDWGQQGKSKVWMAAHLGVIRDTLDNWARAHPDFFSALTLAKQFEQAYWEDLGHDNMTLPNFSASAWSRSMAARFPKDWQDKKHVDHGLSSDLLGLLGELDGDSASIV